MARGDHIYVERGGYTHHGVDQGEGTVIHRAGPNGKISAAVRRATMQEFAKGGVVKVRRYGRRFSPDEAVSRAESMLGDAGYHLLSNNCEHLATWCVAGDETSAQVDGAFATAATAVSVPVTRSLGLELVSGVGQGPALSAPNLMSGLAKIGGSAVGGVVALSSAGGAVGVGMTALALPDHDYLPKEQRVARQFGRVASVGGAAFGTLLVLRAIGTKGVPGYGATGLSSGLASLGGLLEGGMAAGVVVAIVVPLVLAVLVGLSTAELAEWLQSQRACHGTPA